MKNAKQLQQTLIVFRSLRQFTKRSKLLKITAKKTKRLALKGCKARFFNFWHGLYTKNAQEVQLE